MTTANQATRALMAPKAFRAFVAGKEKLETTPSARRATMERKASPENRAQPDHLATGVTRDLRSTLERGFCSTPENQVNPVCQAFLAETDQKETEGRPAAMAIKGARETRATTAHQATLYRVTKVSKVTRASAATKDYPAAGVHPDRAESAATMDVPDPRAGEDALARARARDLKVFREPLDSRANKVCQDILVFPVSLGSRDILESKDRKVNLATLDSMDRRE